MKNYLKHFPFLNDEEPWIYFDSAATTQKPKMVIDALSSFYAKNYATVHRGAYSLSLEATEQYHRVREEAARFLGAHSSDEIIFTKGTTEGLNLLSHSLGQLLIQKDDEILIAETEHHSNILPWQRVVLEKGAHLKVIPVLDSGEIDLAAFHKLLSSRTKILSLSHVSNTTGTIHPVKEMIQEVHRHGGLAIVDGAQAAAHLPINVLDLNADFYLFSGHKIYGPTGIGILYGKKHLLKEMPPYQLGGDMVKEVFFDHALYQEPPLKFEAGTPPFAEAIGLGAALSFIHSIGKPKILKHAQDLLHFATKQLLAIPNLKIIGTAKEKGPLISFVIPPLHPLDIATLLSCKKIALRTGHLCAQPTLRRFGVSSLMRISFGIYNTQQEIEVFAERLRETVSSLKK